MSGIVSFGAGEQPPSHSRGEAECRKLGPDGDGAARSSSDRESDRDSLGGIDQLSVAQSAGIRREYCRVDLVGPYDVQHLNPLRQQVVADDAAMATPP